MTEETTTEETAVSGKVGEIIETIGALTVLELAELVKALEDKFGVSAAAPVMMAAAGGGEEAPPEKDTFDVVLTGVGDKKIQVIKVVREITSLGLKEAKALVDEAPKAVKEGASKDEAAEIQKQLQDAGATVELK
ncbi:MAG: 50S ribosomal protein L7/L12 [Gemmatimonadetes bacterium]|jgi:large subunit ribosomal protein L7/L12|nr:50S ribosomal protein L7/L12 [Gemmatimonadota bacterium]MDE0962262.1 50S ribosomal protein L7/L12 [Candidatus Latescibacterota bacterium]MBT5325835.1 50S ribosomal protein L7/L12 [Gemmatimonadota bacterium]MBT5449078.1 50S ribosomal protein L7/L12 [Gemmatimonadota bacterium]MBT5804557.1 50S ribosomal protein L7/L12 [Gemmatimonadota bacterium]|tara:strand:+ start:2051 stop:2455 length:405 start_codon:yes stop_codon:yes gene_type:complete